MEAFMLFLEDLMSLYVEALGWDTMTNGIIFVNVPKPFFCYWEPAPGRILTSPVQSKG